ncbi:MAG: hypothetical protein HQL69_12050 [Magnetococcales bacterium]|nr:hypothetical protein [Magnetococcales bacterium]
MKTKLSIVSNSAVLLLFLFLFLPIKNANSATCLWISSYHKGYEWNDGIGKGIAEALAGKCEIKYFYMDTKRNPDPGFGREMGQKAFLLMQSLKPDVVIASDDNSSRYFVKPYLKNSSIPVVFCGVNWSVDEYGYPYTNSTGMVEVAPIIPLLKEIKRTINKSSNGLYLSSDVPTEHKDFSRFKTRFAKEGITVDSKFVLTMDGWKKGYLKGQKYDFLILGNNAGIINWDKKEAADFAFEHANKLTVTNYEWMMPYTMMAKTKLPYEQGEWAGNVAMEVLAGMSITQIPIVPNRRWNLYANPTLLKKAGIKLPQDFLISAIKVQP